MSKEQDVNNVLTVVKSICGSLNVSKETVILLLQELADEYDIRPGEYLGVTTETLNDFQQNLTGLRHHAEKMQETVDAAVKFLTTGTFVPVKALSASPERRKAVGRPKKTAEQPQAGTVPKKRGRKPKKTLPNETPPKTPPVDEQPLSSVQSPAETAQSSSDDVDEFARKVEKLKFGKEYQLDILYRLDGRFVLSKQTLSEAEAIGILIPRRDKDNCQYSKFVLHKDAAPRGFSHKMAIEAAQSLPEYQGHGFQVLSPIYNSSCKPFQIEIDMIMKKIGGDCLNLSNAAIARYVCDVE